jgi:hypothetical protein
MIVTLLFAAAAPTAIDAERAFAADAQKVGQWTAFRKYATDDALMFVPQPIKAHDFLKDKADPPVAVFWWPGASFASCDGAYAVNTGPWVREWGKSVGYFTTVWQRQTDGSWKWIYDAGDALALPRAQGGDVKPRIAACGRPNAAPPKPGLPTNVKSGEGASPDGTLRWRWIVQPDGTRHFQVWLWNGRGWDRVVNDIARAPTP